VAPVETFSSASEPAAPRQRLWLFLKAAVTGGILFALFWRYHADLPRLAGASPWMAAAAVGFLLLQPPLIGLRWWLLLRRYHTPLPLGTLVRTTWVSVFANQFLPAGVGGDAVRILYARRDGAGLGAATASVLMDRIMALVALVAAIVLLAPELPTAIDRRIVLLMGVFCTIVVAVLVAIFVYVARSGGASRFPIVQRVLHLVFYVLRVLKSPGTLAATLFLSVLVHVLSFIGFLLVARSLAIEAATGAFLAVAALLTFVQILPISIGGWGVREIAAVTLLGTIGIDQGNAFVASLMLGICYAIASLPGAAIWPFMKRGDSGKPRDHAPLR
jgi:hypothetical protein